MWRWVEQPVGAEVLVDRAERGGGLGGPARSGHAAGRVDDDPGGLDQPGPYQRGQGQGGGRRVAARRGHVAVGADLVAVQLGQAVGEALQQLGAGVGLAVPTGVGLGVGEPEVCGQVDQVGDGVDEVGNQGLGGTVGQGQEHQVQTFDRPGPVGGVDQVGVGGGQARIQVCYPNPCLGVAGGQHHRHIGVPGAQPQELGTRVARGADDADPMHRKSIRHIA